MPPHLPSPLLCLGEHPGLPAGIALYLKRDDLLHPTVQGNKWRKLEPALRRMQEGQYAGIFTFGGPFSNHLHAVAAAGKAYGFPTAAVVRGQAANLSNPTLAFARACGMRLFPVAKRVYDAGPDAPEIAALLADHSGYLILPEGGSTLEAARSCRAIAGEILAQLGPERRHPLFLAVPAGTGCTAAGIAAGLGREGTTLVFPAAPHGVDAVSFQAWLDRLEAGAARFRILPEYGQYGFAAYQPEWMDFALDFYLRHHILLDPLYTVKMMFGLFQLLKDGYFPAGSTVVAVHTGGLQGWAGYRQRYG